MNKLNTRILSILNLNSMAQADSVLEPSEVPDKNQPNEIDLTKPHQSYIISDKSA